MARQLYGFLVDVYCTTESTLEVEVDASSLQWSDYRALVERLSDLLSEIDEKHSVRPNLYKGRSLKARYKRISKSDKSRKIRFSPFPSKFSNVLKNTRVYVYGLISANCLVLERIGRRKLYFLPKTLAPFFVEMVDRINRDFLDRLEKEIEEFRESDDFAMICKCLYDSGIDPRCLKDKDFRIGRYRIDLIPMDFGYSIDEDEVLSKMSRERASVGVELLKREVEKLNKEYFSSAISDLYRRVVDLAKAVESDLNRSKRFVNRIDKLIKMCEGLGLHDVKTAVLEPLKKICEAPPSQRRKLVEEMFKEGISSCVESIVRNSK